MTTTEQTIATDLAAIIDVDRWRSGDHDDGREIAAAADKALAEVGFLMDKLTTIDTAID